MFIVKMFFKKRRNGETLNFLATDRNFKGWDILDEIIYRTGTTVTDCIYIIELLYPQPGTVGIS